MSAPTLATALAVLWRHVRNSRGRPDRLWWVVRRGFEILRERRVGSIVARHGASALIADDRYAEWIARYDTLDDVARARLREAALALALRPSFSIVLRESGTPAALDSTTASLRAQLYSRWQLLVAQPGGAPPRVLAAGNEWQTIPASASNATGAEHADDAFVACLAPGDRLAEDALLRVAQAVVADPRACVVYGDHDHLDAHGQRRRPRFKPAWNPEWFRTHDYVGAACFVAERIAPAARATAGESSASEWDWRAQAFDAAGAAAITHVPRILCHIASRDAHEPLASATDDGAHVDAARVTGPVDERHVIAAMLVRAGVDGDVERSGAAWRIRYRLPEPPPKVTIVIPSRDRAALLGRCIASIRTSTRYPDYEIVVVDNDSTERAALRLLDELQSSGSARVVRFPGAFNFAAECNAGVAAAHGDVVILLNNDTEIESADWMGELAAHAMQPGVAVVGALLLYPDRTIQHAGVVVGVNGIGEHRFRGSRIDDARIAPGVREAQNLSAVTAACAAIRRDRYLALGGLDERLGVANNDIDLCLRALSRGLRNVWTPHACLVHRESVSRGYENSAAERARLERDSALVRERWGAMLDDDPAYNANLTRDGPAYTLAFPPRRAA